MASSSRSPISSFSGGSSKERSIGYQLPSCSKGKVVVKISEEVRNKGIAEWADSIVGKFYGAAPDYMLVCSAVNKIWGHDCSIEVISVGNDTFIFKFSNLKIRDWVLESGPWHVEYRTLEVSKWKPGLQFEKKQYSTLPIWVKLWHVPLELMTLNSLDAIVNAIGIPLNLGKAIERIKNLEYVEVCVEIDVYNELPGVITVAIGDNDCLDIAVEYPWKPLKCIICSVFGHATGKCFKHKKRNKRGKKHENSFGEGCSKNVERDNNSFRLYFKGIVSKEKVGNEEKVLVGIGVALCDPKDALIFEARKSLTGSGLNRIAAEVMALIEGLNASISLDLNSITIYCDYYPLYNFISGKWSPKQQKIAKLVDQVSDLKRKCTYCNTILVARKDVKFAFKFARDAIVSDINRSTAPGHGQPLKENCVICLSDTEVVHMFSIEGCLHRYCFSCIKQHIEVKLLNGISPTCPHEGCKSELNVDNCGKFLTPKLIERLNQHIKEASIPAGEKIYCPYPNCSALMSKSGAFEYAEEIIGNVNRSGVRKCVKCHGLFCSNCMVPWHCNMTCDDYKSLNPFPSVEDRNLKLLAKMNLWRQCQKCQHMIELSEGCYHMTCRCGYEFCYNCGAEWKDKTPTCSCPLFIYDSDDQYDSYDDEMDDDDYNEYLAHNMYDDEYKEEDDDDDDDEDFFGEKEDNDLSQEGADTDDDSYEDEKTDVVEGEEGRVVSDYDEEEEEEEKGDYDVIKNGVANSDVTDFDDDDDDDDDSFTGDDDDNEVEVYSSSENNIDSGDDDEEEGTIGFDIEEFGVSGNNDDTLQSGGYVYDTDIYDSVSSYDSGYSDDDY